MILTDTGGYTFATGTPVSVTDILTVPNTGLHILDTNATHDLIIKPGSNLTADRTFTITTGDTDMIVDFTAVTDEYVLAYDTATNTWRGVAGGGGSFVACRVYKSSGQTVGTTYTALTFDTESFDTDTMHDNATNNTRITIPTTDYYLIGGLCTTDGNANGGAQVRLNGTTLIGTNANGNAASSVQNGGHTSTIYSLTAGDYVELLGYFGSSQTSTSGLNGTQFWVYKIG